MKLVWANPQPPVVGQDELLGKSNYLIGNDPQQWRTEIAYYGKVIYEGVYSGVDLVYYGNQGQLEYDFVLRAGLVQLVMKRYPNLLDYRDACRYLLPSPNHISGRRSLWHAAGSLHYALSSPSKSGRPWNGGNGRPPSPPGSRRGRSPAGHRTPSPRWLRRSACNGPSSGSGPAFLAQRLDGLADAPGRGAKGDFPPRVAIHACGWPASARIRWAAACPSGIAPN